VGLKDRATICLPSYPARAAAGSASLVALINDRKSFLADEPTGNLDAVNEELSCACCANCTARGAPLCGHA